MPPSVKLEDMLARLHTQLYVMHSQVAAWQSSSAPSPRTEHRDARTEKALSLMEECCRMDWEIGRSLLAVLQSVREKCEQRDSSTATPMGTDLPILSNSDPNGDLVRHPSSILASTTSSHAAN
jgi:hypothetical protein